MSDVGESIVLGMEQALEFAQTHRRCTVLESGEVPFMVVVDAGEADGLLAGARVTASVGQGEVWYVLENLSSCRFWTRSLPEVGEIVDIEI